jgi:hypothetical protein
VIRINERTGAVTSIRIIAPIKAEVSQSNGATTVYADSGNHLVRAFGVDAAGNIYTAGDDGILKRSPDGQIVKLADSKVLPTIEPSHEFFQISAPPYLFKVSAAGDVYFASPQESQRDRQIMRLSRESGKISVFSRLSPDQPWGVDPSGDLICPCGTKIIRLSGNSQVTMRGGFSDSGSSMGNPLAIDRSGNLYRPSRDASFQASIQKLSPVIR